MQLDPDTVLEGKGIAMAPFDVKSRVYTAVVDLARMSIIKVLGHPLPL
ncbi:MAG: hypothetical protein WBP86_14465 [Thiobacillaceae bacterium]